MIANETKPQCGPQPDGGDRPQDCAALVDALLIERAALLWACNVYMVADAFSGEDRRRLAAAAAERVRGKVREMMGVPRG